MKRSLLILAFTTLTMHLFASECTSRTIKLPAFNKIAIIGGYKISVVQSNTPTLVITGKTAIVQKIKVSVRDGLLMVEMPKYKDRRMRVKSDEIPTIRLSFKRINNLFADGFVDISSVRQLRFGNLTVRLKGSSKMNISLSCSYLELETNGATYINLQGVAKSLNLHMRGAGMFDGYNLVTQKTDVTIDGTGKARINAQEKLSGQINGFGTLFYKGNPTVDVSKNFGIVKQLP